MFEASVKRQNCEHLMPARAAMSFCRRMFILVFVGGSAVAGCSEEESEGGGLVLFGRGWGWPRPWGIRGWVSGFPPSPREEGWDGGSECGWG